MNQTCVVDCPAVCAGSDAECGAIDGCSCGTCGQGLQCAADNQCVCQQQCAGKECGSDGCTGLCGECSSGSTCVEGTCLPCKESLFNGSDALAATESNSSIYAVSGSLLKLSLSGEKIKSRNMSNELDTAYDIVSVGDGSVIVAGSGNCCPATAKLAKYNSDLIPSSSVIIGEPGEYSEALSIITVDSGFAVLGIVFGSVVIYRLNSSLDVLWQTALGTGYLSSEPWSVLRSASGGFVVGYRTENDKLRVSSLDSSGGVAWSSTFEGYDRVYKSAATNDNAYLFTGMDVGADLAKLVKIGSNGQQIWERTYSFGDCKDPYAYDVVGTPDGGYVLAGNCFKYWDGSGSITATDAWALKLNSSGSEVKRLLFQGVGNEELFDVSLVSDGGVLAIGGYLGDTWTMVLDQALSCNPHTECIPDETCETKGWTCGWFHEVKCSIGFHCGSCSASETCVNGTCGSDCPKDCDGKNCGPDGCGGSCGTCLSDYACNANGVCGVSCTDACTAPGVTECVDGSSYKTCGYYGTPCLKWSSKSNCPSGSTCTGGICDTTCEPQSCTDKGWECGTGTDGCSGTITCSSCPTNKECQNHKCVSECQAESCADMGWDCGQGTDDCGNSLSCGSCTYPKTCTDHECSCTKTCGEKNCGPDGCGGTCGTCSGQYVCSEGTCVCVTTCGTAECGDDGCGGTCGDCAANEECTDGQCVSSIECGDDVCDSTETQSCCDDCGCTDTGHECLNGACTCTVEGTDKYDPNESNRCTLDCCHFACDVPFCDVQCDDACGMSGCTYESYGDNDSDFEWDIDDVAATIAPYKDSEDLYRLLVGDDIFGILKPRVLVSGVSSSNDLRVCAGWEPGIKTPGSTSLAPTKGFDDDDCTEDGGQVYGGWCCMDASAMHDDAFSNQFIEFDTVDWDNQNFGTIYIKVTHLKMACETVDYGVWIDF